MPARYEGTETWQRERPFLISFASQNEELTTDDLALSVAQFPEIPRVLPSRVRKLTRQSFV